MARTRRNSRVFRRGDFAHARVSPPHHPGPENTHLKKSQNFALLTAMAPTLSGRVRTSVTPTDPT